MYQTGNAKEFDEKLFNAFLSIKRTEDAESLFKLFVFHSGHCSICIPTKKWTKYILYHLNTINSFPGHPERIQLRMTNSEINNVVKYLNS